MNVSGFILLVQLGIQKEQFMFIKALLLQMNYMRKMFLILNLTIIFSAAKLFFAYGLGNALTFPLCAGATTVLSKADQRLI